MPPKRVKKTEDEKPKSVKSANSQPFNLPAANEMPAERIIMRNKIREACSHTQEWFLIDDDEADQHVQKMERDCYNKIITSCTADGIDRLWTDPRFRDRYSAECYKLLANLDAESSIKSHYLVEQIIDGSVDPSKIADLSSIEMCPQASQEERDMIELRKKQVAVKKFSKNYICRKCGHDETELFEQQIRALDEGSTIFKECLNCHHRWS
jgi:DNA-directed RNA polymerase subunit M/transcription elongation factor TFIIS